jgi:uncharacterized Zn finger protein (UPF0148 family)
MFCSNCGNSVKEGSLFCSKCGTKINNEDENDLPQTTAIETTQPQAQVQKKQVDSIDGLQKHLSGLKDKEGETALAYALNAQLQVLEVVQSSNLSTSIFDIMLESLDMAIERTENDSQRKLIQQKAAIMVNSMLFFMEAKIIYQKEKRKEDGVNLLKKACNMLADSAPAIVGLAATGGASIAVDANKIFDSINKDRSIIDRAVYFFTSGGKIAEMERDFFNFKANVLSKLNVYRVLFGKSILLAEIVDRLGSDMLEAYGEAFDLDEHDDFIEALPSSFSGRGIIVCVEMVILLLSLVVLGVMGLLDLIPAINLVNAKHWTWTIIKFGSLFTAASAIAIVAWWYIRKGRIEKNFQRLSNYFRNGV